jgi:hypothetical protein
MPLLLILLVLFAFPPARLSAQAAPSAQRDPLDITAVELGARLRYISSDLFEGRYPGTRGEALTTAYLVSQLESFGLTPGRDGAWLQPLSILTHQADSTSPNEARLSGRLARALEHGREIRFSNFAANGDVNTGGELVFVGHGIHAPLYRWDDFAGVDLRGKIAVALLGEPGVAGDTTLFNGVRASRFSWATEKVLEMERRGAVGVLWVRPAGTLARSPVTGSRRLEDQARRSTLLFTGLLADSTLAGLLPPKSPPLADLVARAGRPGFKPVGLGVRLDARFRTRPVPVRTHNVIGVAPGRDSAAAGEHVVLSAHWDAYGVGSPVNGDSIYNGALDDGSGVTALLALARIFGAHPQRRSLTFLFTTAEEWGLLGAWGYVCEGPVPPDRIVANLNLDDGIELLGVKRDAAPLGIELSSLVDPVREVAGKMGLRVSPDPYPTEGFFLRADNFPFAVAGVPSLYMGLGTDGVGQAPGYVDEKVKEYLNTHYHRPSDDYETVVLDLNGSRQFAEFVRDVTIAVANAAERPTWNAGGEFRRTDGPTDRQIACGSGVRSRE